MMIPKPGFVPRIPSFCHHSLPYTLPMNVKIFSVAILFLLAVVSAPNCFAQTNIIQIVADDLGWVDLGTGQTNLGNGSPYYQTPNIDALATGGMAFSSFYAQPTCRPTRAALLTGQYATRSGVYHVTPLNGTGDSTFLVPPVNNSSIPDAAVTIGELLQSNGYTTSNIGKFHCTETSGDIVTQHGFDFNIGGTNSGGPNGTVPYFAQQNNNGSWTFASNHGPELDVYAQPYSQQYIDDNLVPYANGNDPTTLLDTPKHLNDAMADATIDFLSDRVADSEPFFVNVAFNAVHVVVNSRPDLEAKYNGIAGSTVPQHDDPAYAGLLEGLDQSIGRIVDFVEQNGLSGNTIIMFVSDNGGTAMHTDNFPLQGSKGAFQDGGIRVPMIAYQPGTIPAGTTNDEAIHAVDFYRTYATLAGAALPDPAIHAVDGESFSDILTGAQSELDRETIFYHFPGYTNQNVPRSIAIHDGLDGNRYKLSYYYEDRTFELYDLTNDIGETTNLVETGMTQVQFEIAQDARVALSGWLHETEADLLTVRATGELVPIPSHSPAIEYVLDTSEFGATLNGQTTGTVDLLGISMTVVAEGANPVLNSSTSGIGVNSDLDTGGATARQRISGSLATPEGIVVSFDQDVILKQLNLLALNGDGTESLQIQFVAGDNPFSGLSGYDSGGFSIGNDALTFVRNDGAASPFSLMLGRLDQDELLVKSGTTLRITSDPAVSGGILLGSISIALPASLPSVDAVAINDGSAQRSAVDSITLTFDGLVDIEPDAILVVQRGDIDTATGTSVASSFTTSTSGGKTAVKVTFDSLTRNGAGDLVDGNYQITVDHQKVLLDGLQMTEDFTFGDQESDGFYTFFGDSAGDRNVNVFDLLAFRQSYRAISSDSNYEPSMDFEANEVINVFDLLQFRIRYRQTLPFTYGSSRKSETIVSGTKDSGKNITKSRK